MFQSKILEIIQYCFHNDDKKKLPRILENYDNLTLIQRAFLRVV